MEAVGVGVKKKMEMIKSAIGSEISAEPEEIPKALSQWNDNPDDATKRYIIDNPDFVSPLPLTVKKIVTSTGARILTQINQENHQDSDGSLDDGVKMAGKLRKEVEDEGGFGNGENPDEKIGCKSMEIDVKVNENEQESEGAGVLDGLRMAGRVKEEVEDDGGLGNGGNLDENLMSKSMEIDVKVKENNQESEGSVVLDGVKMAGKVKDEVVDENFGCKAMETGVKVKENDQEIEGAGFLDGVKMEGKVKEEVEDEGLFGSDLSPPGKVKEESDIKKTEFPKIENEERAIVKKEVEEVLCVEPLNSRPPMSFAEYARLQVVNSNAKRRHLPQKERTENNILSSVLIEDGDFPEEPEWLLVGRNVVMGLSTTKGRKLENNEIIQFSFPSGEVRSRYSSQFVSSKAAFAASGIVRFSTKRNGEIGRLPMEWSKCLIPLVNSSKVKVLGRCIGAPTNLHLMQDIMLYLSFYIHCSVFSEGDKSSWRLESPSEIDATTYPLLTLFKLLKINPFQEAEFTPEELDSRKRALKLSDDTNGTASMLPMLKRRKGGMAVPDQNKDEQAISESSLNKLVGAADMYDLQEMEPPETLVCDLRPYQKQALFWMTESEKGIETEEASKTLHPCWGAYKICDERAPAIYVNVFSGEAATQLPTATETARGGILADAMGLGKTVMTIALIHARRGRGSPNDQEFDTQNKSGKDSDNKVFRKVKGGTLIVCPMALLGQWKDELESHSDPDSLSVSVYYGSDRSTNPRVIAEPDVILTTYGVLTAAYKTDGENSIFHRVEWYRVVLDEAHTIKSSRTQGAQAAFKLSSYCRWCLTGTPLQNNLEDLYSLLCFLHVEPWCNWAWWQKLIQKPYENGDPRGLKLIKAILRPLMLRRTKDTKDKTGRPILVLPPTDIRVIDCEQSEAEHDFYDALFKRSKVQFDQFVAQGKVLHNYANILELLLRLRQCCNHPFLVMSRADTNADLNKLARKFLETNPDSGSMKVPSEAYVEEVVEGLKKGEKAECPICLESADDPVLTPCAHRMCRECLLSCWRTPSAGACPICRQVLKKTDLITCPSKTRFRIDVEKNWTESSKVSKLLDCLSKICRSGSGEKSIVFSQWTSFLDLLEIPLRRKGIGYLRFDGSLAQKQRERVLKEFNETEEKMVLLMSLKAGGVGLNLTAASNVFLMDPWWNPAVEEQAIMRIHRIGQKRTVRVRRFIVKDTVEERLQQVQARKQRMIAGALTDEEVRSTRLEELKMLFR